METHDSQTEVACRITQLEAQRAALRDAQSGVLRKRGPISECSLSLSLPLRYLIGTHGAVETPNTRNQGRGACRIYTRILGLVLLVGALTAIVPNAAAQTPKPFTLVSAVTNPGHGGRGDAPCGTNHNYLTPVLLFQFTPNAPLSPSGSIAPCPDSEVNDPSYMVFDQRGELFVANRHGNTTGRGSIARFVFDKNGAAEPNGVINDPELEAVHGLAFNRNGELFADNYWKGTISRFLITPHGDAIPNGKIETGLSSLVGVGIDRKGDLYATASGNTVYHYTFDADGNAVAAGSFVVPNAVLLHQIVFNGGEMLIADLGRGVQRIRFDAAGNPASFRLIEIPNSIGLTMSADKELFVGAHGTGGITRFVFDGDGNAVQVGHVDTASLGGLAAFPAAP